MKLPFKLPKKIEERNRVVGLMIGAMLAVIFGAVYLSGVLKSVENFDLDFKFRQRQRMDKVRVNKDIVFLEIDDGTLDWEKTFPDDPTYYNEVVRKLGKSGVGAKGLIFAFDYSRPFGRKVQTGEGDAFSQQLGAAADILDKNARLKSGMEGELENLNEVLNDPKASGFTKDIAGKLNEMVYSEDLTSVSSDLQKVAGFIQQKDLNALSPDREKNLAASFQEAGNDYMIYEGKSYLPTPYTADDLRNNERVREAFRKIMLNPTSDRPQDAFAGIVFDTYQDLKPEDFNKLLASGKNAFEPAITARIKMDKEQKDQEIKELVKQNSKLVFNMPPEVAGEYTQVRHIRPVYPTLGAVAAGQGVGRAEFARNDGTLRSIAPAVVYDGKLYPHIDLLIAMRYLGVDHKNVEFHKDRIVLKNAVNPRTKVKRNIEIPLNENGTMLINWASVWEDTNTFAHKSLGRVWLDINNVQYYPICKKYAGLSQDQLNNLPPEEQNKLSEAQGYVRIIMPRERTEAERTMKKYSGFSQEQLANISQEEQGKYITAQEVINLGVTEQEFVQARDDLNKLKGKIIILGRTAVGTAEINPTPLEPRYHYIGLHANAINTIVENVFIHRVSRGVVVGIFLFLAVGLGFVGGLVHTKSPILTAVINFIIMIFVGVAYSLISLLLFSKAGFDIPTFIPLALIVVSFLFVFLYRFFTEEREKLKMKGMFSTYVNKEVVESLIDNPDMLKLGGEWTECTVFFSDVAGFTSISESLKPEELVELLNEYLTAMTDIIFQYGGTLDKYIGDAIVAVYGAPIHFKDHAEKACLATIDMQNKLAEMRKAWKEQGRHELTARAGVNTGRMIAGNMGSTTRFNYTVMGDNVELGEHLESGGKTYNTIMTISEETKRQAGDKIITRMLDIIQYAGHDKPFRLYEIMAKAADGISDEKKKGIETFEAALELFFKREWDKAIEKFNEVYKYIPNDPPTKKALERCEKMKASSPGPEFDELLAQVAPL